MNEPRRLLRDPETNSLGRALLRAGQDEEAPIGGEERLLALLGLPGGGPPGGGPPGGDGGLGAEAPQPEPLSPPLAPSAAASTPPSQVAASAARSSRLVTSTKALLIAAAFGGTFLVGFMAGRSSAPPATPVAVAQPVAQPLLPAAPAPTSVEVEPPSPVAAGPSAAPRVAVPSVRRTAPQASANGDSDSLAAQLVLLAEARNALIAGNGPEALRRSGAYLQRFPDGALREEASALRVEALWRSGDRSRALVERDRFVDRYPKSVYVQRLHTLGADDPPATTP